MSNPNVSHIFHLSVAGGERHRYGILLAAEIAASKGWKVHDTAQLTQSTFRPDLIISKSDRYMKGSRRENRTMTYWIDIVDTHDPRPDWKAKGLPCDDVIIIDISKCAILDTVVETIKLAIP